MKNLNRIAILAVAGVFLSACSLTNPGAWKSSGTQETTKTAVSPIAAPTQTMEELGNETEKVLGEELDSDFKSIDADLKQLDEELKSY